MSPSTDVTPERIMQVGLGFWASKVLLSAVEMGVFTELSHGPQEFGKLAGQAGSSSSIGQGFPGFARSVGLFAQVGSDLLQHARDRPLPRSDASRATSAECSRWRTRDYSDSGII